MRLRFWPRQQEREIDRMLHWLKRNCESLDEWMFWRDAYTALCIAWAPPPSSRDRLTPSEILIFRRCQTTWFCYKKPDRRGQERLLREEF